MCEDPVRLAPTLDPPVSEADLMAVHTRARAFEDWLRARFPERIVHREVPVLALDARSSVVNAIIDVLVETPSGAWIIDHKTGVPDDVAGAFRSHWPQLDAYALALGQARSDLAVAGLAIHWPLLGVVAETAGG